MILRVDSACFRLCFCDNSSSNDNSDKRYTCIIMALPVHELQRNLIYLHTLCRYTLNSMYCPTLPKILLLGDRFSSRSVPHKVSYFSLYSLAHFSLPITSLLAFPPPPPPLLPSFPSHTLTTSPTARHLSNATLCSKRVAGSQYWPEKVQSNNKSSSLSPSQHSHRYVIYPPYDP